MALHHVDVFRPDARFLIGLFRSQGYNIIRSLILGFDAERAGDHRRSGDFHRL